MARGDPNIPLSVKQRDFGGRLLDVDASNRANRLAEVDIAGARQQQELTAQAAAAPSKSLIRGRTQAMVMDVMSLPNLLDSGQQAEAGRLGLHIRDNMIELGMDTEQMGRTLRLMSQDPAGASRFLKESILPGLQPLLDDFSEDVLDTQGNIIGQRNLKDNKITPIDIGREEVDRNIVQIVRANGNIEQGFDDGQGNFFDNQNNPITLGPGDRAVRASLTGSAEDLGLGDAEMTKLRDSEVAAKTFIATAGDAIRLLEQSPDVNTFVAGAANLVNSLQQEASAIGRSFGVDFDAGILDPATHSSTFDRLGIQNAQVKSLVTSLAFQAAAAAGQTGRGVSDRDVRRFIEEIGANSADPRAFAGTIRDVASRVDRGFRINFSTRANREFEGDLGLEALGGQTTGQEEQTATNPQTGQKIVLRNGRWVDAQTGEPVQ